MPGAECADDLEGEGFCLVIDAKEGRGLAHVLRSWLLGLEPRPLLKCRVYA